MLKQSMQLFVHLGFLMEAAIFIQDDQGMSSLEELHLLTNNNVKTLCKVTHHLGSTVNNPIVPTPQSVLHLQVTNPGIPVAQHAKNYLKLVSYYLMYKENTSRAVTLADITLSNIHQQREHCNLEAAHKDVEPPELTLNWPKSMENLEADFHTAASV